MLHEFHRRNYILPDKLTAREREAELKKAKSKGKTEDDMDEDGGGDQESGERTMLVRIADGLSHKKGVSSITQLADEALERKKKGHISDIYPKIFKRNIGSEKIRSQTVRSGQRQCSGAFFLILLFVLF